MQHSSMEDDYDDCDWYRKNEDGLYCIEVTANRFEDQELQRIARTIQDNTKHTDRLSISCNKFSVARVTALIEALEHNRSVTVFSVFESQITEAVATEICKAIEYKKCRIHTLELMRNQIEDNGAKLLVQALKTNKTITKLSLLGNIYRFKSFAPAIKSSTSIRVLRLHSEHLKSEGCKCLADVLKGHQTIEELHVFETDLTERAVGQLLEVLPTVKSLTTFEFENDEPFDDRACKQLVTLMNSSTLTSLALKVELTSSSAARTLKKALMTNTVLKSLKLVSTDFAKGGKAVLKVLQALKINTTLEHLNIASNEFNSSEWGHKLQRYLQPNSTLKSLNLSYTRLHTCIQPIADIIRCSSSLTDLNLRHNRLEYLVSYVAGALHNNTTLKRLALGYNGDFGISSKAVAYALKTNITLQILDLESNYFEKEVLHALKSNKTITQLNARHIFCGGNSIIGIMKSLLETNTTLWKMDFSENGFSWDEAKQLNKLLELNRKRRASAVQLLMAAQAILLPKDRGIFNALPNELTEMVLRHFKLEFTTAAHTCGKIIALALDRDFLCPSHTDYSRFNKFWDLVLQANHV